MPQNAATYLYPSLSNSYVSPRRGLNGLPSRSQLDAKALTANAATYWKIKKDQQISFKVLTETWVLLERDTVQFGTQT
jgi:hypothetical protein